MFRRMVLTVALLSLAAGIASAQQAAARPSAKSQRRERPKSGAKPQPKSSRPDYKMVFWYRWDDPLGTYRHQAYDLRKGQYTPAVDAWLQMMAEKYPDYRAYVVDVDLSQIPGRTEQEKLAEVSARQLRPLIMALAPPGGIGDLLRPPGLSAVTTSPRPRPIPHLGGSRAPGDPGIVPAPTLGYPFPYPYARPHP
jgi:hypothetical protein